MTWTIRHCAVYHGGNQEWQVVDETTATTAVDAEHAAVAYAKKVIACDDDRFDGDNTPISSRIDITWDGDT